jgi:spermidine/putrescine transport system substrate-binding protein
MKKFPLVLIAITLVMVCITGCGNKNKLILYTWDEMFPQDILRTFERKTGIKINYIIFDTNETMLEKLRSSKGGSYDLVIADDYIIETAIAEKLAQKLNKDKLPNYRNINRIYQKQFYDPSGE